MIADVMARVTRALEALTDEDAGYAEQILDDLLWGLRQLLDADTRSKAEIERASSSDEERSS